MTMTPDEIAAIWRRAVEAAERFGETLRRVRAMLGPDAFDD